MLVKEVGEKNMQLKLTLKICNHKEIDLMVFADQKIVETIQILVEKGFLTEDELESVKFVKSLRTNNKVNKLLTYNQARIYSGDILELEMN